MLLAFLIPLASYGQPSPGSVTDPDNDALPSPNEDPDPDLVSASVTSDGTNLHLSVRLKAGTFDQALTAVRFYFDTDQDPSTGHPGTNLSVRGPGSEDACVTDADNIGPDFHLDMGANLGTAALLLRLRGCSLFDTSDIILAPDVTSPLGTATITFVADGIDAVLPLALLDGDDGLLNFKVRMSELVTGGFSGTLDTMPDVGLPAAMSAIDGGPPDPNGVPTITGVFNAATSVPEGEPGHAVAPGSAVAIFGEGFASHLASPSPVPLSSQQIPLDTTLGDLTATVDGNPMPLFGVFRGEDSGVGFDQFNGQLPWEVLATPEKTEATLIITSNGVSSQPREIWVAPASPGIYSWRFGPGPGIVTNFIPDDPARVEFAQSPGTFCTSFNLSPELCGIFGSVNDPDNDALPSPNEDPDPDLVSASVTSDGTDLHLSVRLKAGTFDQALTAVRFYFDTDQDPSTGNPGTNRRFCNRDTDNIGPDFLLQMGPVTAGLLLRLPGCSLFDIILAPDVTSPLGTATITFVADGIDAVLPLALLDGDDGLLNFKVRMSELITGGFSGTLDTMPDIGLPAAMSAIEGGPPKGQPIVNEKPAKIGGVVTIWANGLGPLNGTVPSGDIPEPGAPLLFAAKTVTVLIGGVEAQVLGGAFLQPQFVSLNQINAIVPEGVEPGDAVPIVIEVDCGDGNVFRSREDVTIAIAPADD